jgi:hypothetical protein
METCSVYLKQLPEIFKTIQQKKIPVKIYNHSGQRSDHFLQVLEIKEIIDRDYQVAVLILFNPKTRDATAIDLKSINMVELESAAEIDKKSISKVAVYKQK